MTFAIESRSESPILIYLPAIPLIECPSHLSIFGVDMSSDDKIDAAPPRKRWNQNVLATAVLSLLIAL